MNAAWVLVVACGAVIVLLAFLLLLQGRRIDSLYQQVADLTDERNALRHSLFPTDGSQP